jgi:hypothetical protein
MKAPWTDPGLRELFAPRTIPKDKPVSRQFYSGCRKPAGSWAAMRRSTSGGEWVDPERIRKNVTELVALTPDAIFATTFPIVSAVA